MTDSISSQRRGAGRRSWTQTLGNGVEETTDYDPSTGLPTWISATGLKEPSAACPAPAAPLVRQLTYLYDHFLNLATQERDFYKRDANGALLLDASCAPASASATEIYQYDELQRLTQASRTWNNMTPDALAAAPTQYTYSVLGNITGKSDYAATCAYPPSGANTYVAPGPHAVTSLSNGMTFVYLWRTGPFHIPGDVLGGFNPYRLGAAATVLQAYYNTFVHRSQRKIDGGW